MMRDRILLFLAVIGFIILLALGVSPMWSLAILLFTIIGYMGLRYPTGAEEIKGDKKSSAYFILTIVMVLLVVYLLYTVLQVFEFPPMIKMISIASWLGITGLFLLSIFYPNGLDKKLD